MDYKLIEEIKENLIRNGHPAKALDISELIASGSTGGEITSMVLAFLVKMKKQPFITKDLKNQIKIFEQYANSIGIYSK